MDTSWVAGFTATPEWETIYTPGTSSSFVCYRLASSYKRGNINWFENSIFIKTRYRAEATSNEPNEVIFLNSV